MTDTTIPMLGCMNVNDVLLVEDAVDVHVVAVRSLWTSISSPGIICKETTWERGRGDVKLKFSDTVRSSVPVVYSSGTAISRTHAFLQRLSRGTCLGWKTGCTFLCRLLLSIPLLDCLLLLFFYYFLFFLFGIR